MLTTSSAFATQGDTQDVQPVNKDGLVDKLKTRVVFESQMQMQMQMQMRLQKSCRIFASYGNGRESTQDCSQNEK